MVTKEQFISFLKEKNFYDAWIEGYNIDNEVYDDNVELDTFFVKCSPAQWLYSGPGIMAWGVSRVFAGEHPEMADKVEDWRNKYQGQYMQLNEEWIDIVNDTANDEN